MQKNLTCKLLLVFSLSFRVLYSQNTEWINPVRFGNEILLNKIHIKGNLIQIEYHTEDVNGIERREMNLTMIDSLAMNNDTIDRKLYITINEKDKLYYPISIYRMDDGNLRFQLRSGCRELNYGFKSRVEMDSLYLSNKALLNTCFAFQISGDLFLTKKDYDELNGFTELKIESKEQVVDLLNEEKLFIRNLLSIHPLFGGSGEGQIHELFFYYKGYKYWQAASLYMECVDRFGLRSDLNTFIYKIRKDIMEKKLNQK